MEFYLSATQHLLLVLFLHFQSIIIHKLLYFPACLFILLAIIILGTRTCATGAANEIRRAQPTAKRATKSADACIVLKGLSMHGSASLGEILLLLLQLIIKIDERAIQKLTTKNKNLIEDVQMKENNVLKFLQLPP